MRAIFERLFQLHGLPKAIRTDNGPPFAGVGLAGLSKLSVWWKRLGIKHERIAPAHPEQNGRHERMHLTLKQHACAPVARDLKRQQKVLEQFRVYYNTERPHEALGQVTPASRYYRSPRPYPARLAELRYPPKFEVRKVLGNGMIKWRGRAIYLSQTLGGERIGLDRSAVGSWPVYFATERLGEIDPARARFSRYEPQPRSARASEKHAVPRAAKRPRPSSSNQASLLEWSSSTTEPGAIFPPPSEASERAAEKLPVITSTKPVTHLPVQSVTHFPVAQPLTPSRAGRGTGFEGTIPPVLSPSPPFPRERGNRNAETHAFAARQQHNARCCDGQRCTPPVALLRRAPTSPRTRGG